MTLPAVRQKANRGRGASCVRTGLFIKEHLLSVGEDFPASMHRELKAMLKANNYKRFPTYHSFLRYFHHFISFGLVEFTGREEPMEFGKRQNVPALLQLRNHGAPKVVDGVVRYYRLTEAGKADDDTWEDPAGTRIARGSYKL